MGGSAIPAAVLLAACGCSSHESLADTSAPDAHEESDDSATDADAAPSRIEIGPSQGSWSAGQDVTR
jgi:hypothetical protein